MTGSEGYNLVRGWQAMGFCSVLETSSTRSNAFARSHLAYAAVVPHRHGSSVYNKLYKLGKTATTVLFVTKHMCALSKVGRRVRDYGDWRWCCTAHPMTIIVLG